MKRDRKIENGQDRNKKEEKKEERIERGIVRQRGKSPMIRQYC